MRKSKQMRIFIFPIFDAGEFRKYKILKILEKYVYENKWQRISHLNNLILPLRN